MAEIKCRIPDCDGEIKDISLHENNGIFGSGFASWKTLNLWACSNCGLTYVPTETNGIPKT